MRIALFIFCIALAATVGCAADDDAVLRVSDAGDRFGGGNAGGSSGSDDTGDAASDDAEPSDDDTDTVPPPVDCDSDFNQNACGGEPSGDWLLADACANTDNDAVTISRICTAVTADPFVNASGTLDLAEPGVDTFDRDIQIELGFDVFIPGPCAAFLGSCRDAALTIERAVPTLDADCSLADPGCNCVARRVFSRSDSGVYGASANVMSLNADSGDSDQYFYCEFDDTLTITRSNAGDDADIVQVYVRQ